MKYTAVMRIPRISLIRATQLTINYSKCVTVSLTPPTNVVGRAPTAIYTTSRRHGHEQRQTVDRGLAMGFALGHIRR